MGLIYQTFSNESENYIVIVIFFLNCICDIVNIIYDIDNINNMCYIYYNEKDKNSKKEALCLNSFTVSMKIA